MCDPPEKIEDAKAKAAIKAQIEADKKARAEKAAKEKALREGKAWTEAGPSGGTAAAASPTVVVSTTKGAEYKDTRLQVQRSIVRLANDAFVNITPRFDSPVAALLPLSRCPAIRVSTEFSMGLPFGLLFGS